MWMTREEIAAHLGIVPNSVRGKVQKGQIERKLEDGRHVYRIVDPDAAYKKTGGPAATGGEAKTPPPKAKKSEPRKQDTTFNPKKLLLDQLASLEIGRSIDAIEKGDEIDLATGEISRELEANISMRKQRQVVEIQDALDRIKHGEYGHCEDCDEPIPEQRLRLFPAARLCVRCQEEADRVERLRRDHVNKGGAWRDETESTYGKTMDE